MRPEGLGNRWGWTDGTDGTYGTDGTDPTALPGAEAGEDGLGDVIERGVAEQIHGAEFDSQVAFDVDDYLDDGEGVDA